MLPTSFYRNVRAREQLELFLLAAIASLLLIRLYLYLTGFPQLGGGGLHIAHMLWGGLLMLAALVISFSFLGVRAQRIVAVVGGVGFGVFIDELGKFITRDYNYFYQPALALIYAIFTLLYIAINFLGRPKPLTSREYQLNALSQLEEAILLHMDPEEQRQVRDLLDRADQSDPLTAAIRHMLGSASLIESPKPTWTQNLISKLRHFLIPGHERAHISGIVETAFFAVGGIVLLAGNIVSAFVLSNNNAAAIGFLVSTLISAAFVVRGVLSWRRSRPMAFKQFRRATLVQLFLPQLFYFALLQFAALPSLLFSLALLSFTARNINPRRQKN